jgi:hypothetical protein
MSSETNKELKLKERECLAALEYAFEAARTLAEARRRAKLSASRPVGVARELKELIKVMSVYGA